MNIYIHIKSFICIYIYVPAILLWTNNEGVLVGFDPSPNGVIWCLCMVFGCHKSNSCDDQMAIVTSGISGANLAMFFSVYISTE
jgi:hypothetical protein